MSPEALSYLRKYPSARTSTLVQIDREAATTAQLRAENEAAKRVNEYRDSIGYASWPRRVLSAIAKGWGAV